MSFPRLLSVRRFRQRSLHRALAVLLAVLQVGAGGVLPRAAHALAAPAAPPASAPDSAPAVHPESPNPPPAFTVSADAEPFRIDRGDFGQGLEVALAVAQEMGIEENEEELAHIYDIGSKIALAADDPSTVMTFYVVKMDEPNAFAVPGGFVFITRGLLDLDLSDDALAHLLGHEITHVRNRHANRMGTWAAISSILQTALVIGLAMGAGGSGAQTTSVDEYGVERVSLNGGAAAVEGAAVFGSVFRELFLRGFSRRLEAEADENGYLLATRAGYDPMGGVQLLESLHQRIYEDNAYGYWRTHPYFTDRVAAARARVGKQVPGPDSTAVTRYRLRAQATLVREARRQEGRAADLVYRSALRAGPDKGGAAAIELELVQIRAAREREKPLTARELGPIVVAADSAIARLERAHADQDDVAKLGGERQRIARELEDMEPQVVEVLDTPGAASNATLEVFLRNYPDHPRAPGVRLALGRRYLRAERPESAIPILTELLASEETPDSLRAPGRTELERAITATHDLSACYSVVNAPPDTAIGRQADLRMQELVAKVDSLENGGRFLKRWPDTPYTEPVRERVAELATANARFARVYEVGGKPQEALDLYNRVVLLAPGTPAASEALRGIERIQGVQQI
jgi:predicted Zn-dependent protease